MIGSFVGVTAQPATSRYGRTHRTTRAALVAQLHRDGYLVCWRCGGEVVTESDLHVGHDDWDGSVTRGPEHARCNLQAAAAKTNGTSRRPRSREW